MRSSLSSPYRVREGQTASLSCAVTDANPNTGITWRWTKTNSPNTVLHSGPNYSISNIQRGRSGSYSCIATNTVGTSDPATTEIDVRCKYNQILSSSSIQQRVVCMKFCFCLNYTFESKIIKVVLLQRKTYCFRTVFTF